MIEKIKNTLKAPSFSEEDYTKGLNSLRARLNKSDYQHLSYEKLMDFVKEAVDLKDNPPTANQIDEFGYFMADIKLKNLDFWERVNGLKNPDAAKTPEYSQDLEKAA